MIYPTEPFYEMANATGYIYEHRLIMAQKLGRALKSWEIIHHLNGIKDCNLIDNLALVDTRRHEKHTLERLLQKRIKELESILGGCK